MKQTKAKPVEAVEQAPDDEQVQAAADAATGAADATVDASPQAKPVEAVEKALAVVCFAFGAIPIGDIVSGPASLIDQHAGAGNVDANPDAVAHATRAGANTHSLD